MVRYWTEGKQTTEQIKTKSVFHPSSLYLNLTFVFVCVLLYILED